MRRLTTQTHNELVNLRIAGKSILEICKKTGVPKTTVQRHLKNVQVPEERKRLLRGKQGGAKIRAKELRESILDQAEELLGSMEMREWIFLLLGLYWGEGTKKDFTIINSDPFLIQTFILCLRSLGIKNERLSLAVRVHEDIPINLAKEFWAQTTGLSVNSITTVEIIRGKKKGKLPHGMCRVRVLSGIRERLLIQTLISIIGKDSHYKLLSEQKLS